MFPKGLGDLGGLMKRALEMKANAEKLKESLAHETVEASAGGGMVKVVMNGRFEIQSVKIEPEIVSRDEVEMLETLIRAAINEAVQRVQELVRQKMTELTGGIEIPGLL